MRKFDNSKINRCEVNFCPIELCFRQGRPVCVCKLCSQGRSKRIEIRGKTMKFEIVFLTSRIFGPGSLGLIGRCRWFVLRASGTAESIAVVCF